MIRPYYLHAILFLIFLVIFVQPATAGPPFKTDDPEPVEFRHWEGYLASQYDSDRDGITATAPHVEVNYGIFPECQFHVILPLEYVKPEGEKSQYGYGDTELGVKYRFIKETDYRPMVGIFPLVEIPTGDSSQGLGSGHVQYFLPLWIQKSWGPWTTYGGGGYWINPGEGNKDWWFFGWLLQREISKNLTLGAEIYYKTASVTGGDQSTGYTVGAIINLTDNHHILLSVGQDIDGPNYYSIYVAYQLTFGPGKEGPEVGHK